jgi:hypothetical protein
MAATIGDVILSGLALPLNVLANGYNEASAANCEDNYNYDRNACVPDILIRNQQFG